MRPALASPNMTGSTVTTSTHLFATPTIGEWLSTRAVSSHRGTGEPPWCGGHRSPIRDLDSPEAHTSPFQIDHKAASIDRPSTRLNRPEGGIRGTRIRQAAFSDGV